MPLSWANIFRALVMLALAFHVFYMYCLARVKADTFGFDLGTTIVAALFALAMLIPLVWAVTLPELPEIWTTHVRARRWWKQGRCPSCGYQIEGAITEDRRCPECGLPLRAPPGYRINAHTIRLFIALNLLAWVIGCAAGELWILRDEREFVREFQAGQYDWVSGIRGGRSRRWPNSDAGIQIHHAIDAGFDQFEFRRLEATPSLPSPTPSSNTD
jgi:hypothetical protein